MVPNDIGLKLNFFIFLNYAQFFSENCVFNYKKRNTQEHSLARIVSSPSYNVEIIVNFTIIPKIAYA